MTKLYFCILQLLLFSEVIKASSAATRMQVHRYLFITLENKCMPLECRVIVHKHYIIPPVSNKVVLPVTIDIGVFGGNE